MKPDCEITREFTKESFDRSIDSCGDVYTLRDLCKRGFNLYLNERDLREHYRKKYMAFQYPEFLMGFGFSLPILLLLNALMK